jgi:hypothetical protein
MQRTAWNRASTWSPSNGDLTLAEVRLMGLARREYRLREVLSERPSSNYQHVLIDCPPSLNLLTVNALVAADGVLIPMQCEYYALEGLTALMGTIESIQRGPNPKLRIAGLLRTMFDPRNRLSGEVSDQLLGHFGERVFRTIVPRNVRLAEAPSFGQPALLYDANSRGAVAYLALAGEMLRRPVAAAAPNARHCEPARRQRRERCAARQLVDSGSAQQRRLLRIHVMVKRRSGLGRGLEALLSSNENVREDDSLQNLPIEHDPARQVPATRAHGCGVHWRNSRTRSGRRASCSRSWCVGSTKATS